MIGVVVSSLVVVMGVVALGLGVVAAKNGLQRARRRYDRTTACATQMLDGWDSWFLSGFSTTVMGMRWVYAIAAWFLWTLIGVWLVGLGIRLFSRV